MSTLPDLQQQFLRDMRHDRADALRQLITAGDAPAQVRLDVHRNNIVSAQVRALEALYPVVRQLVGKDFFAGTAQAYVSAHPARTGVLADYGQHFPDFLTAFDPAKKLPYLSDVAALELAWHQAYGAADAEPLPITALAELAPDQLDDLRLALHSSLRLISSPYPVGEIWRAHQDGTPDLPIQLDSGPAHLAVLRPTMDVLVHDLPVQDFQFLQAVQQGAALSQAAAATSDLAATLANLFQLGCFKSHY